MTIALESSTSNRSEPYGLHHGMSVFDSPETGRSIAGAFAGGRRLTVGNTTVAARKVVEAREDEADASTSSSIGRNSDSSAGELDGDGDSWEGEVQSSYKGPLDSLDALEEVLPVKRGISKFYSGKSKSFTSLGDATSCSSIKEIVKPENAYTRKRKNLLAHSTFWDNNRNYPPTSNCGGMTKRPASARSTLALAATVSSYENNNNNNESSKSNLLPPTLCRTPLYPHSRRSPNGESSSTSPERSFSTWRSLSLSDLQCAAAATPIITGSEICNGDKDKLL